MSYIYHFILPSQHFVAVVFEDAVEHFEGIIEVFLELTAGVCDLCPLDG